MRRLAAFTTLLLLGAGCSGVQVQRNWDRTIDFSGYRTYRLRAGTPARDEQGQRRLDGALSWVLAKHGLEPAGAGTEADLEFVTHVWTGSSARLDTKPYGVGYWGAWGYVETGSTSVEMVSQGSLVVDVVDAKEKRIIWRSTASDRAEAYAGPNGEKLLRNVFEDMLQGFPPPPPKAKKP